MPVHLEVGGPQRRKREWRAALLFAIAGLILLPVYQTGFSPDTTAYLIVAEHYLHGRWDEAINGLWGPLASWLLAPFLGLGINGLTAFRFINLAAATGTLLAFRALATQLRVGPRARRYCVDWPRAVSLLIRADPPCVDAGSTVGVLRPALSPHGLAPASDREVRLRGRSFCGNRVPGQGLRPALLPGTLYCDTAG